MKVNEEKQFPIHLTVGWATYGALFGILCAIYFPQQNAGKKRSAEAPKNINENQLMLIRRELISSKLVTHGVIVVPNLSHSLS